MRVYYTRKSPTKFLHVLSFKGSGGGRKRQRLSVISYKESILTQLLEAKNHKETELGRRDPSALKKVRKRERQQTYAPLFLECMPDTIHVSS